MNVHNAILNYLDEQNKFIDGLPLFIIRNYGSLAGEEGAVKRRRGWLVRFENAWVAYADNFLTRHFFEASYFASSISGAEVGRLVNDFCLPLASGGGRFEKLHRSFPAISHLTANSSLYLSHVYDLNKSKYVLNGRETEANIFLGGSNSENFGCGQISDWDNGIIINGIKKGRRIKNILSDVTLQFLKAYNVRMLSPLNYFPFPKASLLKSSILTGEAYQVRDVAKSWMKSVYGDDYKQFLIAASTPNN